MFLLRAAPRALLKKEARLVRRTSVCARGSTFAVAQASFGWWGASWSDTDTEVKTSAARSFDWWGEPLAATSEVQASAVRSFDWWGEPMAATNELRVPAVVQSSFDWWGAAWSGDEVIEAELEMRVDPFDGRAYTWEQMVDFYAAHESAVPIQAYWLNECIELQQTYGLSPAAGNKSHKRIDPLDGLPYTFDQIMAFYTNAGPIPEYQAPCPFIDQPLKSYWKKNCIPLRTPMASQERLTA